MTPEFSGYRLPGEGVGLETTRGRNTIRSSVSTFVLGLPPARSMKQPRSRELRPLALVADDEPLMRRIVCAVLRKHNWRTLEAHDGIAAFAASLDERLDLLVTDFEMPLITGLELANAVRRNAPDLPVLMISGRPDVEEVARGFGYRFLPKPFAPHELVDAVLSLTGNELYGPRSRPVPTFSETDAAGGMAARGRR